MSRTYHRPGLTGMWIMVIDRGHSPPLRYHTADAAATQVKFWRRAAPPSRPSDLSATVVAEMSVHVLCMIVMVVPSLSNDSARAVIGTK